MPIDRFKPIEIVSPLDPRLDTMAMDMDAYAKTYDPALIRDKDPENKAARFTFRPMTRRFFNREINAQSYGKQVELSILAGIIKVVDRGDQMEPKGKPSNTYGQSVADPDWYEELASKYGDDSIAAIANGVVTLSKLPDSDRPTSSSPAA